MAEVIWQGGCELRDEEGVRIGNLYVTTDDVIFIEAGRGGMTQYRPALATLGVAGALLLVPISAEIYAWTYKAGERSGLVGVLEVIACVLAVGMVVAAARVAVQLKQAYIDGLISLGASDGDVPEVQMLIDASHVVNGSLLVPRKDAEKLERVGPRLTMETRLGETWDLLILPDPTSFIAAVTS
ncbi:MAG: hypothetical protein KDA24_14615 [Deltaproteobacteria bacterium]|nr:hypothetical protein [Deltaproteobacteria bacterium]